MKNFGLSLLALWKQLGVNQRVSLVVAFLAVAGGLTAISVWSRRPDYQLLYARLGDKDAAQIVGYLESQNIPHEVSAGGTAVSVPSDQVYKIRMDLAGKGLPSGDGVGFEIFDKGQFGLSDFIQRTNYLRAVQGELARTITQLQGVRAARVMIVQPENRLLLTNDSVKSTASVFVDLGGGHLEISQVDAIRHLVANSVQDLVPDQVAVVDNHGHILSEELKQDPTLGSASSQMKFKEEMENYLAKKVETMLAAVVGPGNAIVRVAADIDSEATTVTDEKYDPQSQVIRSETDTEDKTNQSETRSGGGSVGVSANVPEKTVAADTNSSRPTSTTDGDRKNKTTTYEINRTLTNTTRSPGTVKNVTASVFVAQRRPEKGQPDPGPRTPAQLDQLRQIVIDALGVTLAPGQAPEQVVALQEQTFAAEPVAEQVQEIQSQNRWMDWVQASGHWATVAGAIAVLLIFLRVLSRQRPEPVPVEVFTLPPEGAARALPSGGNVTPDMVNELIKQKPTNVGTALRGWVAAGKT